MVGSNSSSTTTETNMKLEKDVTGELLDITIFKHITRLLRYLCHSRPNILYAFGIIGRFMCEPRASHLLSTKRLMR